MIKDSKNKQHSLVKQVYQTPKVKMLGSVNQLTLKMGSNTDGEGTFA